MEAFSCLRTNFLLNGGSDFNIKEVERRQRGFYSLGNDNN